MRELFRSALLCGGIAIWLASCSGGGTTSTAPLPPGSSTIPTTATNAPNASATYPLGAASTSALPSVGGVSGSIALPAVANAPSGATMTVTASASPPAGSTFASTYRAPQSGTLTVFYYTTIRVSNTIDLPQIPGFSFNVPASIATTTGTFFYAISDPAVTAAVQFRTEGPATVNGQLVTFALSPNPLTLTAGTTYVVAFYRITGQPNGQYQLVRNVAVPNVPTTGVPFSFDISFVDPNARRYYLADRTNSGVDVVDVDSLAFLGTAKGFAGAPVVNGAVNNNNAGPNGVATIKGGLLAAGDGDSTLKIVDPAGRTVVATQLSATNPFTGTLDPKVAAGCVNPAGGVTSNAFRLDELAFDPADNEILAINDADCPPYGTFFSGDPPYGVKGSVSFGTSFNGVEQPVWDPGQHVFLLANPQTVANPFGEIDVIDPHTFNITKIYPLPLNCIPHGLALGPNENVVVGCNAALSQILVMNATNGSIVGSVPGYGGSDECWYSAGDNRYYCALSSQTPTPLVIAIDATTVTLVATIPTVTQAHSVAVDQRTNRVFVPRRDTGISVYSF